MSLSDAAAFFCSLAFLTPLGLRLPLVGASLRFFEGPWVMERHINGVIELPWMQNTCAVCANLLPLDLLFEFAIPQTSPDLAQLTARTCTGVRSPST